MTSSRSIVLSISNISYGFCCCIRTQLFSFLMMGVQGTEDTAVPLSYAVQSANRINNFGQPFNLTANLTRLVGAGHLLVTPTVMTAFEEYISQRAPGTIRFLIQLVQNLTDTFSGINKQMKSDDLKEVVYSGKSSS